MIHMLRVCRREREGEVAMSALKDTQCDVTRSVNFVTVFRSVDA